MRHRLHILSAMVVAAVLLAAGGRMIAVERSAASSAIAPAACTTNPPQDVGSLPNMVPVTSCAGGCPFTGECDENTGACVCPSGPGHCVVCGPHNQSVKCVPD